jgi:hypothetical protein
MTQEEKSQAQDVLDGLLRDSYQKGYNQGFKDGNEVGGPNKASKSVPPPPPPPVSPADGTILIREGQSQQEAIAFRACVDCRHCHTIGGFPICQLASKIEPDPVTGRRLYIEKVHCSKERKDGQCGPEGKNFEREGKNFESRQRRFKGERKD